MLDPRIYRTGLVVVVLATFVLAFSLDDQQGPLGTTLAPDAFNSQNVVSTMTALANDYPVRHPGSAYDYALATHVAQQLRNDGFAVSTDTFKAQTVDGTRTLETVTGTRAGSVDGSIVVVAHRDAAASPAIADLSGTALLLELARVLQGETQHRSIILASTSGSGGSAGALELARTLPKPVDAVIVLGDLAGARVREPIVVPWSSGTKVAPPMLRNTVGAAVTGQALLKPGGTSLAGQLARLVLPLSVSEQAPFAARGEPAVLLSVSGERGPSPGEPISPSTLGALGRAVLVTVNALDTGPQIPAPSAYVLFDDKVVPGWALRVFVLALLAPVLMTAVDGLARARRRGHQILPWVVWVLAGGLPFVLGVLAVRGSRLVGLISVAPPGAVGDGAVPLHGGGIAALGLAVAVVAVSFAVLRPLITLVVGGEPRRYRVGEIPSPAAGVGVVLVLGVTTLAIWVKNPFAAGLIAIALNLWIWIIDGARRLRPVVVILLLVAGLAAPVAVVLYYASNLGLGPIGALWNGTLLIAGGGIGTGYALGWAVALGGLVGVVVLVVRTLRADHADQEVPITVRGPIGYAGPGSLGGTESALRRTR